MLIVYSQIQLAEREDEPAQRQIPTYRSIFIGICDAELTLPCFIRRAPSAKAPTIRGRGGRRHPDKFCISATSICRRRTARRS